VLLYGVVSVQTEKAVELFPGRGQTEAFIADLKADEPELAATRLPSRSRRIKNRISVS
jgi:hypothetical protein